MLSDNMQYEAAVAGTAAAAPGASAITKFTVLRFNSDKKSANASQKRRGLAGTVSGGGKKSRGSKISKKSKCSEFKTVCDIFGEAM